MTKYSVADGLVINLHFTDACNFRCKFCHSHFGMTPLTLNNWKQIIDNIMKDVKVKRFNLAGGEPMAAPYVQELIDYIHSVNVDCSIITNGSLLDADFIRRNKGKLSMIGISVDGVDQNDDLKIGRADINGKTLSKQRLIELANLIHEAKMTLKINTVVNALNWQRDFSDLIGKLKPQRWKILRMISIKDVNDAGEDLQVSDQQFDAFVMRHHSLAPVVEDSADIIHAYIVVNPHGQLIDNSNGAYRMSHSLLTHTFADEFSKVGMDFASYMKRYQTAA